MKRMLSIAMVTVGVTGLLGTRMGPGGVMSMSGGSGSGSSGSGAGMGSVGGWSLAPEPTTKKRVGRRDERRWHRRGNERRAAERRVVGGGSAGAGEQARGRHPRARRGDRRRVQRRPPGPGFARREEREDRGEEPRQRRHDHVHVDGSRHGGASAEDGAGDAPHARGDESVDSAHAAPGVGAAHARRRGTAGGAGRVSRF